MRKLKYFLFIFLLAFSLIASSWYQIHGDIMFSSDIGRDFLILNEISQKKIILIGPRASGNLFHGPGWPYLNYPFYFLGSGNPVIVGFGWVFYSAIFVFGCFLIAKKLFNKNTAYLFSIITSIFITERAYQMINPDGAMFFIPLLFYLFVKYYESLSSKYLTFCIITALITVQIELALGIPLIILVSVAILYKILKTKNYKQILLFLLVIPGISNFILFDIRHGFIITHNVIQFISPKSDGAVFNYAGMLSQRLYLAFSGVNFLKINLFNINFFIFAGMLVLIYNQIKENKHKLIYLSFLYFYFGYFVLSFIDKGPLLYFYQYPMFPLVFLIFSSLVTSKYSKLFFLTFSIVILLNIISVESYLKSSAQIIGKSTTSWKFLKTMSDKVFSGKENKFGYFVYAPDSFAYAPKYAMLYTASKSKKVAEYFVKEKVTYVTAEPPPPNNMYMKPDFWITDKINLKVDPTLVIKFQNGYEIRQYKLSNKEMNVIFDNSVDPGLNFR